MSNDLFPVVEEDEGPTALVDMLLGLHTTLTRARKLVIELAHEGGADAPLPMPGQLVDVLLGLVALSYSIERALPPAEDEDTRGEAERSSARSREGLLR